MVIEKKVLNVGKFSKKYFFFENCDFLKLCYFSENETVFPKIFVCSHSQHSLWKINKYYPGISKEWIRIFYGGFQKVDGRNSEIAPEMVRDARF